MKPAADKHNILKNRALPPPISSSADVAAAGHYPRRSFLTSLRMGFASLLGGRPSSTATTFTQDRRAMAIAARYGLTAEYKLSRRHGFTPLEALDEWDLLTPEDRTLFYEQ